MKTEEKTFKDTFHIIKYDVNGLFLGRNGYFKQSGIQIQDNEFGANVILRPITSKKRIGRASLVIPRKHLAEFIKALQAIA
jgi:hypothetical protein